SGNVLPQLLAIDRHCVKFQVLRKSLQKCSKAACVEKVLHQVLTAGSYIGQHWRFFGSCREIIQGELDPGASSQSDQVYDCIRGTTQCQDCSHGILEGCSGQDVTRF